MRNHPNFDRIRLVMSDPQNAKIKRESFAGKPGSSPEWIYMNNGYFVHRNSYYSGKEHGYYFDVVAANKGVHEPQEEFVFKRILDSIEKVSYPVILELGSGWAFYSTWFLGSFANAYAYLVDSDPVALARGEVNCQRNGFGAERFRSVQRRAGVDFQVDDFIADTGNLTMLHADIQGDELAMLEGADYSLSRHRIEYVLVSTHTDYLHEQCLQKLKRANYHIIADIPMSASFAYDGFIAASVKEWGTPQLNLMPELSDRRNPFTLIPEEEVWVALSEATTFRPKDS